MASKKAIACCVGVGLVSGIVAWAGRGVYDRIAHTDIYSKLGIIESVLEDNYLFEYDKTKAADYAALGLSLALDDPYTVYYNKEQFTNYVNSASGDFIGIGITVVSDKENDEIKVISVTDNSPAFEAGILPGDVITAIEGERFSGSELSDALVKMRGEGTGKDVENTSITVTIKRDGVENDLSLVRKRIHENTVSYEMLNDKIGYIRISAFNTASENEKSTDQEFTAALDELLDNGMRAVIFDVRDNGGGDAGAVSNIIDRLVPEGLIMYAEDKHGNRSEVKSDSTELDIPMVVLVNGNSASASELFAGALRDYEKATIVGTKTYGKGIMQQVFPFSDGSGMTVTIAKYFTPSGICVHQEGITPDVVCEQADTPVLNLGTDADAQLIKAIEILK